MRDKMKAKPQYDTVVNLVHKDMVVSLCDTYAVENTQGGEKVMILDPRAPMSLARRPWLDQYLEEFDCTIEDMKSSSCYQIIRFGGINKRIWIDLPLMVRGMKGKDEVLKALVYIIDADVAFLCRKKILE